MRRLNPLEPTTQPAVRTPGSKPGAYGLALAPASRAVYKTRNVAKDGHCIGPTGKGMTKMKNIDQMQTVEVYRLIRAPGRPWVASLVAGDRAVNAEGETPSVALIKLANMWPKA